MATSAMSDATEATIGPARHGIQTRTDAATSIAKAMSAGAWPRPIQCSTSPRNDSWTYVPS